MIACAGDAFYIDRSFSKREYELIFGGVLMIFAFVPVRPCSDAFQSLHGLWAKTVHLPTKSLYPVAELYSFSFSHQHHAGG